MNSSVEKPKYGHSITGCLRVIWKEDGFRGFYKGNGANVVCCTVVVRRYRMIVTAHPKFWGFFLLAFGYIFSLRETSKLSTSFRNFCWLPTTCMPNDLFGVISHVCCTFHFEKHISKNIATDLSNVNVSKRCSTRFFRDVHKINVM